MYRVFIKTKILTQLSGGHDDFLIAMVAELLAAELSDIHLKDDFPAKKVLEINRNNIPVERMELLGQIGQAVKRALAAGVGLPYVVVILKEALGEAYIGGKMAGDERLPPPYAQDVFNFEDAVHAGGKLDGMASVPPRYLKDSFNFEEWLFVGGKFGDSRRIPPRYLEELFELEYAVYAGGILSGNAAVSPPRREDYFSFNNILYIGGKNSETSAVPVPEKEDTIGLGGTVGAGGRMALGGSVPVPAKAYVIIFPHLLKHSEKAGGFYEIFARRFVPLKEQGERIAGLNLGGSCGLNVRRAIPLKEDAIRLTAKLRAGGFFEGASAVPLPVAPNVITFSRMERKARAGGIVEGAFRAPIAVADDVHNAGLAEHGIRTGGTLEGQTFTPLADRTLSPRTSGTRAARIPVPEI